MCGYRLVDSPSPHFLKFPSSRALRPRTMDPAGDPVAVITLGAIMEGFLLGILLFTVVVRYYWKRDEYEIGDEEQQLLR